MTSPDALRPRRRPTPTVDVGGVLVGSAHPVVVQSMTNTDTADADATAIQVARLAHAGSELVRYSPDRASDDPAWQASIAPVFAHVCGHCHVPGGEAGIDLSTPAKWQAERDETRRRVLVTNTMPPAGTELGEADRRAIEAYLAHP